MLITKGDLVHQMRKITTSGLAHHFEHVEVVLEKDADTYARILDVDRRRARAVLHGRQLGAQRHPPRARRSAPTPCTSRTRCCGSTSTSTTTRTSTSSRRSASCRPGCADAGVVRSGPMDTADYLDALRARLAGAARRRPRRRPGGADRRLSRLDAVDLVWHIGEVHDFWGTVVRERLDGPLRATPSRDRPDGDDDGLRLRRATPAAQLLDALASTDPATPVWTWSTQQRRRRSCSAA